MKASPLNTSLPLLQEALMQGQVWFATGASGEKPSPQCSRKTCSEKTVSFSFPAIDLLFPQHGLSCGDVHEFFSSSSSSSWFPAILPTAVLLRSFLLSREEAFFLWVGKRCFPTPFLLQVLFGERDWNERCFFLSAEGKAKHLWVISQLLQSTSSLVIVADGSRFSFLDIQRLQFALEKNKEKGGDAFCVLLRPSRDLLFSSSAQTRWLFEPAFSQTDFPCWSLELLRAKGRHVPQKWPDPSKWIVEVPYEKDNLRFCEISQKYGNQEHSNSTREIALPGTTCEIPLPILASGSV